MERRLRGTLTHRQQEVAKRADDKSTAAVSRAIHNLKDWQDPARPALPPGLGKLPGFMHRFRLKLAAKPRDSPVAGHHEPHHFEHCRDFCNASLLLDHGPLLPDNSKITCSDTMLRVIDMRLSPERVCVPLICPALLDQVFSLLPRPWNLKVSTDGAYRLLFDSYTLITLGINVKNWSPRKDLRIFSFRSSFLPLGFALADTENDQAYTHLSQTVLQVARTLGHEVTSEHILQWHGDMHKGIEAARRAVAPSAARLADWAHVTGATSQGPAGFHGLLLSIGQFLDQHTLAGDTPLRKEGRTCAKGLLAWGLHSRFEDGAGNVWMLVPTSKYKRDSLQPQNRKGTKRYKDRIPLPLPPNALRHFSCIVTANDTRTVESGLERLGLYDCENHQITNWKHLAKLLDDWRCVVSGPFVTSLWRSFAADAGARSSNKHALWLCFGCHVASLWGPCEHAYACMEHEGQSSGTSLPTPKPKGRPPKRQKPPRLASMDQTDQIIPAPTQALPGQLLSSSSSSTVSSDDSVLRAFLRSAGLGHLFPAMSKQGVTMESLRLLGFGDLHVLFQMSVRESHILKTALQNARCSAMLLVHVTLHHLCPSHVMSGACSRRASLSYKGLHHLKVPFTASHWTIFVLLAFSLCPHLACQVAKAVRHSALRFLNMLLLNHALVFLSFLLACPGPSAP